jgi:hypothetical protein
MTERKPAKREPSCATCRFWEKGGGRGFCHRHAPRDAVYDSLGMKNTVDWPMTDPEDWCGEWKKGAFDR